jgi:hypothetical protein
MPRNIAGNCSPNILSVLTSQCSEYLQMIENQTISREFLVSGT